MCGKLSCCHRPSIRYRIMEVKLFTSLWHLSVHVLQIVMSSLGSLTRHYDGTPAWSAERWEPRVEQNHSRRTRWCCRLTATAVSLWSAVDADAHVTRQSAHAVLTGRPEFKARLSSTGNEYKRGEHLIARLNIRCRTTRVASVVSVLMLACPSSVARGVDKTLSC